VMVEAMACGTPVVALHAGSVPEVIEPGVTGFVANTVEELVEVVGWVPFLDREQIREITASRFDASRMVAEYEALYRKVVDDCRGRFVRPDHAAAPAERARPGPVDRAAPPTADAARGDELSRARRGGDTAPGA
jgi:hypothetical protein